MTKKRQTVRQVDNIKATPITAAKNRALDRRLKKRYDRLRKRYKEIRGKEVDWIDHDYEEGFQYVGIRFTDGTYFSLLFSPQILTEGVEFSDMSSGDDVILRQYYRRQDD